MGTSPIVVKDTMIHAFMGTSTGVSKEALIHMDWSIFTAIVKDTGIHVSMPVLQAMVEGAMIHVFITTPTIMAEAIIPLVAIPIGAGTAMIRVATALLLATVSHVTQSADATAVEPFPVTLTESLPDHPSLQDVGHAAPIVAMIALSQKNIVLLVDLSTQFGLPCRADTSGPPKSSFGLLLKRPKESKNSYILDQVMIPSSPSFWKRITPAGTLLQPFSFLFSVASLQKIPSVTDRAKEMLLNTMHAGRLHSGWDHCYPNCSPMTMTVHPPPLTLSIMTPAQYSPGHPACIKPHNPCAPVHCWDGRSHYGYHGLPHSAAPYFTTPALPSPKCLPRSKSGYAPYRTY
ncbi:hypothetical protein NXF25_018341 [Crotalus adamanteus]|uniref:Uncharacterized protein n=1 Tax=Crotalus adamanteus TaxID=8729 RepID=A0AAW1ANB9_CROAD